MGVTHRTRATEEFLAEVIAVKGDEEARQAPPGHLIPEARALMTSALLHPEHQVTRHYKEAGLPPAKGKRGLDALMAEGYGRLHHLLPRGRGGRSTLLEITEAANPEIARIGLQRPAPLLKGEWLHDVAGRLLRTWVLSRGYSHWFEKTLGRKTFDCVHEEGGRFVAWEICVSGSADWAIQQATKGLENQGVLELRIMCKDMGFEKDVQEALKKLDSHGVYSDRIKTCVIADFL